MFFRATTKKIINCSITKMPSEQLKSKMNNIQLTHETTEKEKQGNENQMEQQKINSKMVNLNFVIRLIILHMTKHLNSKPEIVKVIFKKQDN